MQLNGVFHPSSLQPEPTAPFFLLLSSVVQSWIFLSALSLLFASQPGILPVLMWQAWEMKSFMSGEGEHLPFFFSFSLSFF